MSGGHFDYKQWYIDDIADEIESVISKETGPRPPAKKEKHQYAYRQYNNGSAGLVSFLAANIEWERLRYLQRKDIAEVSDIEQTGAKKSFKAVSIYGEKYVVCEDEEERYFDESGEEVFYRDFKPETLARFREAVGQLRRAAIFAQRIDWLLSGDDGEDSFLRRIDKELAALDSNNQQSVINNQ